jgi:hypothetical protein
LSEEVEIKTKDDAMELVFRLTRFEMQYPKFAQQKAEELINKYYVDPIRQKMEEKGYSKKISERVRAEFVTIDTDGYIEFDIISDFESDEGFDVAKMMEEGRIAYRVVPKVKKWLHWIEQGVSIFRKKSDIPRREGDDFINKTLDEMQEEVQTRLSDETDRNLIYNLEN